MKLKLGCDRGVDSFGCMNEEADEHDDVESDMVTCDCFCGVEVDIEETADEDGTELLEGSSGFFVV